MKLLLCAVAVLGLFGLSACDTDDPRSPLYRDLAGRWERLTPSGQREALVLRSNATFRLERDGRRIAEGELGYSRSEEKGLESLRSLSYTISLSRYYSEGTSDSVVTATPTTLRLWGCIVMSECRGEEPNRVYLTERTYIRAAR